MNKKHNAWLEILVGPILTIVALSFWHYTDNTKEELHRLDTKIETKIGGMRREVGEVRQFLTDKLLPLTSQVGELRGQVQKAEASTE